MRVDLLFGKFQAQFSRLGTECTCHEPMREAKLAF